MDSIKNVQNKKNKNRKRKRKKNFLFYSKVFKKNSKKINKHVLLRSPEWCLFFLRLYGKTRPNFGSIFSIITSKHAKLHHIKNHKNYLPGILQKWLKIAILLDLEGQILNPFFKFVCKTLLNMTKNILKSQKIPLSKKIQSAKDFKNGQKRAKMAVFRPRGSEFWECKKGLDILLLLP